MTKKKIQLLSSLKDELRDASFQSKHRSQSTDFGRQRKLTFSIVTVMIINNISKSLSVELTKFLQNIDQVFTTSKQAFSKARYKLKPAAFIALNDSFVKNFYSDSDYELYKGKYLLLATDGSNYELPWEAALIKEFGVVDPNQTKTKCMGKGVKIWDVLNQITVNSILGRYDDGELPLFEKTWTDTLNLLSQRVQGQLLLLADRHYPSFGLMISATHQNWDFVFRCKLNFCREVKAFIKSGDKQAILEISLAGDTARRNELKRKGFTKIPDVLKVRALRVLRSNGELSCLLTSIAKEEMNYQEIVELYPHRWSEETSYYFDKHRTEIENFSAKLPQGIYQDWYANTLATNIAQLLIEEAQQQLDGEQKTKDNKYQYKINRSVAVGIVKDELPKFFFDKECPQHFFERLVPIIKRNPQPIRPNRASPRKKKHNLKFSMNLRKVL